MKIIKIILLGLLFLIVTNAILFADILNVTANSTDYVAVTMDDDKMCTNYVIKSSTGTKFYLKESNSLTAPIWTMEDGDKLSSPSISTRQGATLIWVKSSIASDIIEVLTTIIN